MMKKLMIAPLAALFASKVSAGNLVEPMMEPDVVEASTGSSGGGMLIPILLLLLLAAAATSGGSSAPVEDLN